MIVDIGGSVGAAIVYTDPDLIGVELEVRRRGAAWDGTHVAIRERRTAVATLAAALYESLTEGEYECRLRPTVPGGTVHSFRVDGGAITETHWPA